MLKIAGLLTLIFFALKVAGVTTMSWLAVFTPMIIWLAFLLTVIVVASMRKSARRARRWY